VVLIPGIVPKTKVATEVVAEVVTEVVAEVATEDVAMVATETVAEVATEAAVEEVTEVVLQEATTNPPMMATTNILTVITLALPTILGNACCAGDFRTVAARLAPHADSSMSPTPARSGHRVEAVTIRIVVRGTLFPRHPRHHAKIHTAWQPLLPPEKRIHCNCRQCS